MSGVFGGKKAKSQTTKAVSALQVQTSTFGSVLPLLYGKNRIAGNLGWYGNWIPTAHTEKQSSGGKGGGGGSSTSTSYTYTTGVIILLCEGPIGGVGTVWKDKELHSLSDLGLTLFTGTTPQTPWTWLASYNPSQSIPYNGMAYVGASALQLGSSTGLPNLNYEVKGLQAYNPGVVDDALPSDILTDYLTDPVHGAGFAGYLGSTAQFRAYCLARGLFMSPIEDQQRTAADFVNDMAKWCNFAPVWSYNQLLLIPYGDTPITGTYGTYTPNVTPLYDLGPDDFRYDEGSDCGVELDWKELEQCHNSVRVEYNDRANSYNTVSQEAKDQADIDSRGAYPMSSISVNGITQAQVARDVAQLMLQRDLYIRKQYHFRTGLRYMLLEPMDIVTLTDANAGLNRELVRITKVTEQDDEMEFEAEELPIGVAHAPQYAPQNSGGYSQDFNVSPGSVSPPVIFNAPGMLTQGGFETWIAVAGVGQFWGGCDVYASEDNTTYQRVGRITGAARYGALTAALPAGSDPDTTHTAQLSLLRGQLNSGSTADADNWRQLAFVGGASGGEFIAFRDATLTGTLSYQLGYLRRGGYGSTNQAHVSTDVFVRIDEAIFRLPYDQGKRGNTVYFKFVSFNVFGSAMEQLSAVTAYSHVLGASDVLAPPKLFDQLAGQYATPSSGSNFIPNPSFELNNINAPGSQDGIGLPVCDSWYLYANDSSAFTVGLESSFPDVGARDLTISVKSGTLLASGAILSCRVTSAPIQVAPGQQFAISGDIRTDSAGGNSTNLNWLQSIGILFFNSSNTIVSGGDINSVLTLGANAANGTYVNQSTAQVTVPAGASYARAYVYLGANNTGGGAATLNSWAARFDKMVGTFVTSAGQVNYATGETVDSLKPAQAGADVTAIQTIVGIVNPQFEQGITGWTSTDTTNTWAAESNGNGPNAGTTNHMVHGPTGTGSTVCIISNVAKNPIAPGAYFRCTAKIRPISSPAGTACVRFVWIDSTGAIISAVTGSFISNTSGQGVSIAAGIAPSNAVGVIVGCATVGHTSGNFTFDDVQSNYATDGAPSGTSVGGIEAGIIAAGNTPGGNLIPNPLFAMGTSLWSFGSNWIVTSLNGEPCAGMGINGTATTSVVSSALLIPIGAGVNITFGLDILLTNSTTAGDVSADIQFYNSSGTNIGSSSRVVILTTGGADFVRYTLSATTPSGTASVGVRFFCEGVTGSGGAYVKRLKLEKGTIATPFNDDATQFGNNLTVVGSKQQLGDQRNMPTVSFGNFGSGWSGLSFSYTCTTTSATISASAASLQAGSNSVSYNASSVTVSGSAGTTVVYYLYYDDPLLSGGSQTLQATTNNITALSNNSRLYLGKASVTYPTSGTGGGSGGGNCVTVGTWLPGHGAAGEIAVGDQLELVEDAATFRRRAGRVTYAVRKLAPCVRIITESGIALDCSTSAPILCSDESLVLAPQLAGRMVPVSDFGDHRHERVIAVEDLGEREVIHITCENSVFLAGRTRGRYLGHHNLKPT